MPRVRSFLLLLLTAVASAQVPQQFVGMGDSIGEGVQSADASWQTQPHTYLSLIAKQMGVNFPLPLIVSSPISIIENVFLRTRLNPNLNALNLAVSGATVDSMLNQVAGKPVKTEADLVLEPRTGTQMQIAQSLQAQFTVCWIGNSDVLKAVLAWDHLNATQMTSVAQFTADYATIATDLRLMSGKVVVGTIPSIPEIAFVFNHDDVVAFLGQDFGLPADSLTTLPTVLLIKLGLAQPSLLQNPDFVLDATEAATIQQRVDTFNAIIKGDAADSGLAVADIATAFQQLQTNPPVFHGVQLTRRFNGGLLSLDGVHPSDIGHGLAANIFIQAANQKFNMNIPMLTQDQLTQIADADPFIDWNGDLKVRGRPLAGLLETLGPVLGISGDLNDHPGTSPTISASKIDKAAGQAFMQRYLALKGLPSNTPWGLTDAIQAIKEVFNFHF